MKQYLYFLLLFLGASAVCLAVGYGATRLQSREEAVPNTVLATETVREPYLAEEDEPAPESGEESEEEAAEEAGSDLENRYYLVVEDGFLLVFPRDGDRVCMYTHVPITDFPESEQERLRAGIWFSSMLDIFNYLESYTS